MSTSRRGELQRAAFGRASTAQDRAIAVRELRLLDDAHAQAREQNQQLQLRSELSAVPPATVPAAAEPINGRALDTDAASSITAGHTRSGDTPDRELVLRPKRHVRAIWLAPIILASLAVGAMGGSLWGSPQSSAMKPSAPATLSLGTDGSGQPGGDLVAADKVFTRQQTDKDAFPLPDVVQNLNQSTLRFLGESNGAVQLWVGRNSEDEFCLLAYESASSSAAASCATPANFTAHAITLGFNKYQVSWDGKEFTVFTPYGS